MAECQRRDWHVQRPMKVKVMCSPPVAADPAPKHMFVPVRVVQMAADPPQGTAPTLGSLLKQATHNGPWLEYKTGRGARELRLRVRAYSQSNGTNRREVEHWAPGTLGTLDWQPITLKKARELLAQQRQHNHNTEESP